MGKRLSMRRIHRLMTLRFGAGAETRAVARELVISHSHPLASTRASGRTVREYLACIAAAGIGWPLPADVTDAELERRSFVNTRASNYSKSEPFEANHLKAAGRFVTLVVPPKSLYPKAGDQARVTRPGEKVVPAVIEDQMPTSAGKLLVAPGGRSLDALGLSWLPVIQTWPQDFKDLRGNFDPAEVWRALIALARTRVDFLRTLSLDRVLEYHFAAAAPPELATKPVRLAVLGSSTVGHLLPGIRVAGLRRGIWLTTYEPDYAQYVRELADPNSGLHRFAPTAVLFAFDARHLASGVNADADAATVDSLVRSRLAHLAECWELARDAFGCQVVQQSALPVFPRLLGNNEHRLPGSAARVIERLNEMLPDMADQARIDLLAIHARASEDGLMRWHDPALWHQAKQEVSPAAAPLYGDMLARLLAARQGLSYKCLVLDLDNTLWGGVIGDDGLESIEIGQGSALGEAFVAFQSYARDLGRRGVILAVCSKNDEAVALAPFEQHPEMLLKRADIACFAANWEDKAANIRRISHQLNIGLDSLVFVDDNPFERDLVRRELPLVAVPELPDDPSLFAQCLSAAGYFEAVAVTSDDRERSSQYQANLARATLQAQAADLPSYLRSLEMELIWKPFDRLGLQRIVQLINKTNQFNLTTRRYTEADILAIMQDPRAFGLQLRLLDRFGDNGTIAIVIGRAGVGGDVTIDTWLMSCRVLGRQVEQATLLLICEQARRLGGLRLVGEYLPTAKNGMVRDHYTRLGFEPLGEAPDGRWRFAVTLRALQVPDLLMAIKEG
jgi:FkbH-like protein